MAKILLVNPPLPKIDIMAPEIATTAGMMPPMGLLALASYMKETKCGNIKIVDLQKTEDAKESLQRNVRGEKKVIAGITCCLFTIYDAYQVAKDIKEIANDSVVIMGGHQVSVFPEETAALDEVDYAIFGEGEESFCEVIKTVEEGRSADGIPGVATKDENGKVAKGKERKLIEDIDTLPHTDRSFLEREDYTWVQDRGRSSTILFAGRGCPFKCSFCFNVMRSARRHSPEYVVEDMRRCKIEGFGLVNFYDETFNINRERTLSLADAIAGADLGLDWTFRGRCDVMDPELAAVLYRSGCRRINFGIEAGTNETLRTYRKQITVEQARSAVECAAHAGIEAVGYFILGAPEESREQCMSTIEFACSLPLGAAQFMVLFPLPGTELYDRSLAEGGFEDDYLRKWSAAPVEPLRLRIWNTGLDEKELLNLVRTAYRRFYINPRYILQKLVRLTSFAELKVAAAAAMSIVKYIILRRGKRA